LIAAPILLPNLFKFDASLGLAAFTAIPLFLLTIMELRRNIENQRASFLKEYISQFFTNPEIYKAFHDLVYSYTDDKYGKIQIEALKDQSISQNVKNIADLLEPDKLKHIPKPFFVNGELQGRREEGARFFLPTLCQFSPEERRLDSLLGYFDVIGFYVDRNIVPINQINGSIGYFLAQFKRRQAVQDYIDASIRFWDDEVKKDREALKHAREEKKNHNGKTLYSTAPYFYLQKLLERIELFNEALDDAKDDANAAVNEKAKGKKQ